MKVVSSVMIAACMLAGCISSSSPPRRRRIRPSWCRGILEPRWCAKTAANRPADNRPAFTGLRIPAFPGYPHSPPLPRLLGDGRRVGSG